MSSERSVTYTYPHQESDLRVALAEVDRAVGVAVRNGTLWSRLREDAEQDLRVHAFEQILRFDPSRGVPLRAWIRLKLSYQLKNFIDRCAREKAVSTDPALLPDRPDLLDEFARAEERLRVRGEVRRLPARQRAVIVGRYGLAGPVVSEKELAGTFGETRDALAACHRRALRTLRERLDEPQA